MARVCQFILATVTVGTNGAVLAKYEIDDFLIFTEALATIALVTSAIRLFCPMKWNFKTFLYDFLQLVAWAIALGFLANVGSFPFRPSRSEIVRLIDISAGNSRDQALWLLVVSLCLVLPRCQVWSYQVYNILCLLVCFCLVRIVYSGCWMVLLQGN